MLFIQFDNVFYLEYLDYLNLIISKLGFGGFPGGSEVKVSAWNAGDQGSIPGSGRSPEEGNGNPLQYSSLENAMQGGAWQATVHGIAKSQTRLSAFTFTCRLGFKGYHFAICFLFELASLHSSLFFCFIFLTAFRLTNNRLVPNKKRSTSRLYIVTLLI